ncbi:TPA: hypothetical protein I9Y37_001926 [Citrobacter freundii]|nr:hypothetical protein [Citrobacter freundii]HAT3963901.1 hypothetical protein [Citrobacter freundii]
MKLSRQNTSDIDRHDKERSITGYVRASELMRGNKHHFIIENATAAELEAMDDLLCETEFKHYCDICPLYDEGYSCGWWVDVDDVAEFKATYKRLKGQVAARVQRNMATEQGDKLDAMNVEEVETVARVARQVARELRSKQESISSLRAIGTDRAIIMNPYYSTYRPISQKGWELIHAVLMVGTLDEVISWLYTLELNAEASIERRPTIAKLMECEELTYEVAHRAIREANNSFAGAVNLVRAVKAKANSASAKAERLSAETGFPVPQCLSELEAEEDDYFAARDRLRSYVEVAHAEALRLNLIIDMNFTASEDKAFDAFRKQFGYMDDSAACRNWLTIHEEALEMNAEKEKEVIPSIPFNPTIANDGLTEEQGKAYNAQNIFFYQSTGAQRAAAIDVAHAEALEINRETPRFGEAADLLSERIDNGNSTPLNAAETLQVIFWTKLNSVQREQAIENAHTKALFIDDAMNR